MKLKAQPNWVVVVEMNQDDRFKAKAAKVMREYHKGKLKSGSGQKVTSPEQAKAIAMSEAREAVKKRG